MDVLDPAGADTDLSTLWARHYDDLVRYVSGLLSGDVHAAEDIAQETGIRLWQHPEVVADGRPLVAWLRTVARNLVVDRGRRRRARPAEVALGPRSDRAVAGEYDGVVEASSVNSMLAGLSSRHRAAVVGVYVLDRPVAAVADDLGIPAGTVKSRCHTALRQLRDSVPAAR